MATTMTPRDLERVRYWQGQMLRSGDLRQQIATAAQLRAWHNRASHQAYGIAFGFAATPVIESGVLVGVQIAPGVAYDCFGRELILESPRTIALPAPPPAAPPVTIALLASYGTATIDLQWRPAASVTSRDGVAIAQIEYANGVPTLQTSFTPYRPRPMARPRLATGSTIPGGTTFTQVPAPAAIGARLHPILAAQTIVDTSGAGFVQTPHYFASLQGVDPVALSFDPFQTMLTIFTNVQDPTPNQFTFRVTFVLKPHEIVPTHDSRLLEPALHAFARAFARSFARVEPQVIPYICWLGCEEAQSPDPSLCASQKGATPCCCS